MSEWHTQPDEGNDDDPAVTLGDLRDGETVTLTVDAEPELFDSDQYGRGIRVPSTFEESDFQFENDEGDRIIDGDDVTLVSWSKRLRTALTEYDTAHGLVGDTITITKIGHGMDVQYDVTEA